MTRVAILLVLMLAACQQASPPADNTAANVAANTANAAEAVPPFAETPDPHPTAPEPAPIPATFRGAWAESKAACADRDHHSRLTISGRTIRYPGHVLFGAEFTTPAANQIAVAGKVEGTDRLAEAHFSINATGDVLTDEAGGGAVRVRCG